jgi:hypothetical protein
MRIIILILETLSQQLTRRGERSRSKNQAITRFIIYKYGGKTRMDGIRCEIFFRKNLNPKFINRVRRIMTTMIWPYEKHG